MLTIVIVNFYSEQLIKNCVDSIIKSENLEKPNIVIVDNGSKTSILNDLEKEGVIQLIKNPENKGFGKACNIGAKLGDSKYLLFLNPDTKVYNKSLVNAINFLENNSSITVLGCKQVDENNRIHRSCARYVSLPRYLNKLLRLNKVFPKIFKGWHMSDWDHNTSSYVDHVIGAFYLIRREDFVNVDGFCEDYFVYYEDLDLSKKITDVGGKIYYNADIEIFHEGGGTSQNVKAERLFYSLDSFLLFSKKHLNYISYLIIAFFVLFIEPFLRLFSQIIALNKIGFLEIIKSYKMLYKKRFL